ncbi:hypothetical protein RvY_12928 [Ramazzottius varieornatus]|uniref:Uncharacterized protein n=1 Tax=Ramazzottius varieornatus TaxID=947166 RepID=A0A1D1VUS6_RAMVA|nr:hypothetical protein RvY_12928 [Ramazzottius varieornatus]
MPSVELPEEAIPKDKMAAELMQWITKAAEDFPGEGDTSQSFLDEIFPPPQEFEGGVLTQQQEEVQSESLDHSLLDAKLPDISVGIMWPLLSSELNGMSSTSPWPNKKESLDKAEEPKDLPVQLETPEEPKDLPEVKSESPAEQVPYNEEGPKFVPEAEEKNTPEELREVPECVFVGVVDEESKVSGWEDFITQSEIGKGDFSLLEADQGMGSDFGSAEKALDHPATYTEEEKPLLLLDFSPQGTPTPPPSESTSITEMKVSESEAGDVENDLEQLDEWMEQDPSLQPCPTIDDVEVSDWATEDDEYVTASKAEPESAAKTKTPGPDFLLPGSTDERWYNTSPQLLSVETRY